MIFKKNMGYMLLVFHGIINREWYTWMCENMKFVWSRIFTSEQRKRYSVQNIEYILQNIEIFSSKSRNKFESLL